MGLTHTLASILAATLVGALTRSSTRIYSLLVLSVLALYWFQPAVPFRSFDFWIPSLSLALVLLVWFAVSPPTAWKTRENKIALLLIVGIITLIDLTRYTPLDSLLTTSTPPQIFQFILFTLIVSVAILQFSKFSKSSIILIFLLITILLILKSPTLSTQASLFFRTITNRPLDSTSPLDLRWLGFSYIAFRLIHVLRDKQLARLPELTLPEFATYVVFFPTLSAGPIDRAERFATDLRTDARLTHDELFIASQRIVIGLFKKFVIADALALIALNDTLATQVRTPGWLWIHLYAYAFQIYFDFSGYTDIALGIARLVGIKLPENFASPYTKPNLTQFWNNWHMTLTQWIRAYFFNPFNRWLRGYKSLPMWAMLLIGQLATMLIIGLWHGVTVNFIVWGLWHGLGLFLQNRYSDFAKMRLTSTNPRIQTALHLGGILLTFHYVALGWAFFALSNPVTSWNVLLKLFNIY